MRYEEFFIEAIRNLRPGAIFGLSLESDKIYNSIEWPEQESTKPREEEIQNEIIRLEQEYINKEYQRLRTLEYPSIQEQLDMQYWDKVNNTTVWEDTIAAIKEKYPKEV